MLEKLLVTGTGKVIEKLDVVPVKGTLVVVPQLLVKQWVTELALHAPTLSVFIYQSGRDTCAYTLAKYGGWLWGAGSSPLISPPLVIPQTSCCSLFRPSHTSGGKKRKEKEGGGNPVSRP